MISSVYNYSVQKIKFLLSRRLLFMIISLPLTLGVLGWLVWRQKEVFLSYQWDIHPIPAVLAFLVFSIIVFATAWIWTWMMRVICDSDLGFWKHLRVFCISTLGKRLPGTVWYIAWRAQIYNQDGHSSRQVSLASGVEVAISTLSAAILSVIFAIPILMQYRIVIWGLVAILLISIFMVQAPVIRWIRVRLKIDQGIQFRRETVIWTFIYVIIRILVGIMFFMVVNIIYPIPLTHLSYVIGAQALVACMTMSLFFFPTNFGFAEVSLSLLLSAIIPSSIAVIVVVLNRILMIIFEFVWAAGSVMIEVILKKRT